MTDMQNIVNEEWVAAYYPESYIRNPRSKAILCLLFDKIICHFPVADMICGGGQGMSELYYGDSPLVENGIIELKEEYLLDEVKCDFTPGLVWGTEEEFDLYNRLQVTGMTINNSSDTGSVPITDFSDNPIPANVIEQIDIKRFARLQATALAVQSLKIALPPFKVLI